MAPRYEALITVTDQFCKARLTEDYAGARQTRHGGVVP